MKQKINLNQIQNQPEKDKISLLLAISIISAIVILIGVSLIPVSIYVKSLIQPVSQLKLVSQQPEDSDGDGLPDELEKIIGSDPDKADSEELGSEQQEDLPPSEQKDTDGDGLPDELEKIIGSDPNKAD
jgi:hypothetical protein